MLLAESLRRCPSPRNIQSTLLWNRSDSRINISRLGAVFPRSIFEEVDSSTAYKNSDSHRHDPLCRVLNMELLHVFSAERIVRHLWRMCFGFFIATGSFFLGQQQVFPAWLRGSSVLFIPALLPLVLLIF